MYSTCHVFSLFFLKPSVCEKLPNSNDYLWRYCLFLVLVAARRRAKVSLALTIRPVSLIELACTVRQPDLCVRALCEFVALLPAAVQEHDPLATMLQCNTKQTFFSYFGLHSSHLALHTQHFTLHTSSHLMSSDFFSPRLTSAQLSSSRPISSYMSSK